MPDSDTDEMPELVEDPPTSADESPSDYESEAGHQPNQREPSAPRPPARSNHRYISSFHGASAARLSLLHCNTLMNVAPNRPGPTGNYFIRHDSYDNAGSTDHTEILKCNLYNSYGCPFRIRDVEDARGSHHHFGIAEHHHVEVLRRRPGLTTEQRAVLEPFLEAGNLRPVEAMRILATQNGGFVDTNGRPALEWRNTVLRSWIRRQRGNVARVIGDTFGDILSFARTHSLFGHGANNNGSIDENRVGVIYARVGNIIIHGESTSSASRSASGLDRQPGQDRTPVVSRLAIYFVNSPTTSTPSTERPSFKTTLGMQ